MTDIKKQRNLLVEVFKTKMSHTKSATTEKYLILINNTGNNKK